MSGNALSNLSVKKGRDYHGLYYIEGAPFRISFWTYGADIDADEAQRRLDFANELVAAWNNRQAAEADAKAWEALRNISALARKAIDNGSTNAHYHYFEGLARAALTKEPGA